MYIIFTTRKRRSVTSVTSTGTTASDRNRNNSNASQVSHHDLAEDETGEQSSTTAAAAEKKSAVLAYKVAMLGDSGVGKTALTYQFTTSDYICAYDLSLGKNLTFTKHIELLV